ncbi:MAG: hypothetical protein WAV38_34080 [Xanthobacteraceae bacterium]
MTEIKTSSQHPASMSDRIAKKLDPSCSPDADIRTTQGSGPTRVHTAIHHSGSAKRHGEGNSGEPGIDGAKRTVVRTGDGK